MAFEFTAIFLIPFSVSIVLVWTQPIFAALVSYFLRGERLSRLEVFSIFSALFGVVMMANPQLFLQLGEVHHEEEINNRGGFSYFLGCFLALSGALSSGFAYYFMRNIGTTIPPVLKPLYFGLFSTLTSFFCLPLVGNKVPILDMKSFLVLSGAGLSGWLAQEGVSYALSVTKAGRAASINYL